MSIRLAVVVLIVCQGLETVFCAEENRKDSLEVRLDLNEENGDLTTTIACLSPRATVIYTSDVYAFGGFVRRPPPSSGVQQNFTSLLSRRPKSYYPEFAQYLPEELEQLFPTATFTLRLTRGKSWKHSIKVWEIAIWDDLVKYWQEHPDMRFVLILSSKITIDGMVETFRISVDIDGTTIDKLQTIKGKFPEKKFVQVKWLFYPRMKRTAEFNAANKKFAEEVIRRGYDKEEKYEKIIAECDAKAALYEKFKQWDAKTLREQRATVMRPWRGQNGMPLDFFAKVVRLEGDTITFEDDEGRSFEYGITELADNDQEYVRGRYQEKQGELLPMRLDVK